MDWNRRDQSQLTQNGGFVEAKSEKTKWQCWPSNFFIPLIGPQMKKNNRKERRRMLAESREVFVFTYEWMLKSLLLVVANQVATCPVFVPTNKLRWRDKARTLQHTNNNKSNENRLKAIVKTAKFFE